MNNLYFVFSCLGLAGGLLCATGDILFDLKGRGNQKLGTSKNGDSNWTIIWKLQKNTTSKKTPYRKH